MFRSVVRAVGRGRERQESVKERGEGRGGGKGERSRSSHIISERLAYSSTLGIHCPDEGPNSLIFSLEHGLELRVLLQHRHALLGRQLRRVEASATMLSPFDEIAGDTCDMWEAKNASQPLNGGRSRRIVFEPMDRAPKSWKSMSSPKDFTARQLSAYGENGIDDGCSPASITPTLRCRRRFHRFVMAKSSRRPSLMDFSTTSISASVKAMLWSSYTVRDCAPCCAW